MGVCAVHELWMFIGCGEDGVRAKRALLIKLKVTDVQGTTRSRPSFHAYLKSTLYEKFAHVYCCHWENALL